MTMNNILTSGGLNQNVLFVCQLRKLVALLLFFYFWVSSQKKCIWYFSQTIHHWQLKHQQKTKCVLFDLAMDDKKTKDYQISAALDPIDMPMNFAASYSIGIPLTIWSTLLIMEILKFLIMYETANVGDLKSNVTCFNELHHFECPFLLAIILFWILRWNIRSIAKLFA